MPTFKITNEAVIVIDDIGHIMTVDVLSAHYQDAVDAVMSADWEEFQHIALRPELALRPEPSYDEADEYEAHGQAAQEARDEHDLANWNGSPIYYLTKEQAQEQVDKSMGFWAYHDFGIAARCGRRYATVPNGFGPTAPEGYEWACVPVED